MLTGYITGLQIYIFIFSINDPTMSVTDPLEMGKRLKRSLDGYITYRKAVGIAIAVIVFFLYIGPGLLRWLLGSTEHHLPDPLASCLEDKLGRWAGLLAGGNGHVTYKRPAGDSGDADDLLHYVGNGYIGMAVSPDSDLNIKSKRTLSSVVRWRNATFFNID